MRMRERIKQAWVILWGDDRTLIDQCDYEMASGALVAIKTLLDSGNIPRGTFADDQVRNLVALYNQRGDHITQLEAACERNGADHARYWAAASDTLKNYPTTDLMALVTLSIKLGVLTVPPDTSDIEWAHEQIAHFEQP